MAVACSDCGVDAVGTCRFCGKGFCWTCGDGLVASVAGLQYQTGHPGYHHQSCLPALNEQRLSQSRERQRALFEDTLVWVRDVHVLPWFAAGNRGDPLYLLTEYPGSTQPLQEWAKKPRTWPGAGFLEVARVYVFGSVANQFGIDRRGELWEIGLEAERTAPKRPKLVGRGSRPGSTRPPEPGHVGKPYGPLEELNWHVEKLPNPAANRGYISYRPEAAIYAAYRLRQQLEGSGR